MNSLGEDGSYTEELMLCWGLVQARREQKSQTNIEPVYYYSILVTPIMGTKDTRHQKWSDLLNLPGANRRYQMRGFLDTSPGNILF